MPKKSEFDLLFIHDNAHIINSIDIEIGSCLEQLRELLSHLDYLNQLHLRYDVNKLFPDEPKVSDILLLMLTLQNTLEPWESMLSDIIYSAEGLEAANYGN